MDYTTWPYVNLLTLKHELEKRILAGDVQHKATLKAFNAEIESRKFILIATLGGHLLTEYGRWRTNAEAELWATQHGLPVDADFEFSGIPFKTKVIEI
jgi:hypothetical protein